MNSLIKNILSDIKVNLLDEFDRNFERKAFFYTPWEKRKHEGRGSLLVNSGRLRRSIRGQLTGNGIRFTLDAPYASIHNNGGIVKVTAKMKRYFWAKYYQNAGSVSYNIKSKTAAKTKRNTHLSKDAERYKAMALMKVGRRITIPKRQFIGDHPVVRLAVKQITEKHAKELIENRMNRILKPR